MRDECLSKILTEVDFISIYLTKKIKYFTVDKLH